MREAVEPSSNVLLAMSRINNVMDNKPEPFSIMSREFFEGFRVPVTRGPLRLDEYLLAEKSIRDAQKDGEAIIPGAYSKRGTRKQEDQISLSVVTLDIDDGNLSFDELCAKLEGLGLECLVHTSYSHSSGKPKYRVFILLKQPITGEIKPTLERIIDFFDDRIGNIDPCCRKPGQLFFTPACPPDGEALYRFRHLAGTSLDPADFPVTPAQAQTNPGRAGTALKPGEDYGAKVNGGDLLVSLGWSRSHTIGDVTHYTRPGKKWGVSGTFFHNSNNFYCHTSAPEAQPFECDKSYSVFGIYALINHGGDHAAAARELGRQGYGDQTEPAPQEADLPLGAGGTIQKATKSKKERVAKPSGFPERLTDSHVKNYYADMNKDCIRFSPGVGWLFWDDKRWCTDAPGGVFPSIDKMLNCLMRESSKIQDEDERIKIRKSIIGFESHSRQTALISACQNVPKLITTANQLDQDNMLLNCLNGTIALKTGNLRKHDPADRITRIVNIKYDPAAKCPTFLKFLTWAMCGDLELVEYLQRFIGYCLSGDTSEQVLNFWYGTGANGKSTLMNVIKWLLGDYGTCADTSLIMKENVSGTDSNKLYALATLRGARLVALSEVNEGQKLDEASIKSFTGGDTVTCRQIYQVPFSYTPQAKLIGFGNYRPHVRGTDHGIWRRIHLIPFLAVIPDSEKDSHLSDKLRSELPGVLAWAIRGCLEWQKAGLRPPPAILDAVKEYRAAEDVFQSWLTECCTLDELMSARASELIASFKDFSGWKGTSDRKFGELLKARGFVKRTSNGVKWQGLCLLESGTLEPWTPFPVKSPSKTVHETLPKKPLKVPTFQNDPFADPFDESDFPSLPL
jgi:P4 family phage/plasmid primase-like protien